MIPSVRFAAVVKKVSSGQKTDQSGRIIRTLDIQLQTTLTEFSQTVGADLLDLQKLPIVVVECRAPQAGEMLVQEQDPVTDDAAEL